MEPQSKKIQEGHRLPVPESLYILFREELRHLPRCHQTTVVRVGFQFSAKNGCNYKELGMEIRIISAHAAIAYPIAVRLEESLQSKVQLNNTEAKRYELIHRAGLPMQRVSQLLACLQPLSPVVRSSSSQDVDFELYLGDSSNLENWNVSIHSDTESLGAEFHSRLQSMGFSCANTTTGYQQESKMLYGGATPFARQIVQWLAREHNITLAERKDWSEEDHDIWIYLRHPKHDQLPPRECFEVEVTCDHLPFAEALKHILVQSGFSQAKATQMESFPPARRFQIDAGPFSQSESQSDMRQLEFLCRTYLEQEGLDLERYPLRINTEGAESLKARVSLPWQQWQAKRLLPYAGPYPDRFELVILTDSPDRIDNLLEDYRKLDLAGVSIQTIRDSDPPAGFEITWGAASEVPHLTSELERVTKQFIRTELADEEWDVYINRRTDNSDWDHKIQVSLPLLRAKSGSLKDAILSQARHFDLTIYSPELERLRPLIEEMRSVGFKTFDTNSECHEENPLIRYGGAAPALIEHLRKRFQPQVEKELTLQKSWDDSDDDIWIYLPRDTVKEDDAQPSLQHRPDLQAWLAPTEGQITERIPFIAVKNNTVRIGDISLPRHARGHSSLAPDPSLFEHYCIDAITAETLNFVATSVAMREPCLLEGETSTSKTSAVLYLAALINQPVVRLNLNGQTDTSELIGRFVPDTDHVVQRKHLTTEELAIRDEGPSATLKPEVRSPWRWQDGLIVQAMRKGWWVLLDEVNLAEPQILERLNSVLEQTPSLILTEYDNAVLGPGGEPVHPDFRLFATMNPAEYEGRSTLSPAYRDRWRAYRFVPPPGETEYTQMLNLLVYGQQPEITVVGQTYQGSTANAAYGMLAESPVVGLFLDALARFHASLEHAVRPQGASGPRLGNRRRERYIFTRRGLLSFIDFLANLLPYHEGDITRVLRLALYRYYLARIADPGDQMVVIQLLDAVGIGPNQWLFDAQTCDLLLVSPGSRLEDVVEKLLVLTDNDRPQAEHILEHLPYPIYIGISLEEVQQHRREWEAIGATVELSTHTDDDDDDDDDDNDDNDGDDDDDDDDNDDFDDIDFDKF